MKRAQNVWHIDREASKKTEWFKEWPNGKKFALLITYDVEQAEGLQKRMLFYPLTKSMGSSPILVFFPGGIQLIIQSF